MTGQVSGQKYGNRVHDTGNYSISGGGINSKH